MRLGKLVDVLARLDPEWPVPHGFGEPHSYRGYYDQVAFEPVRDTTVGRMLDAARSALGQTFTGYKGGEYVMGPATPCWLARWGYEGEELDGAALGRMVLDD